MAMTKLVFRDDAYAKSCQARIVESGPQGVSLDRTVFYPRGGGQPGDSGRLVLDNGVTLEIIEAVKGQGHDSVLHLPRDGGELPAPGQNCRAEIDWDRRYRFMRMHTAMHILSSLLPYPVTGGQVGDGKGRLDFDIPEAGLEKETITQELNRLIALDSDVTERWISDQELADQPDLVKTMSVRPPTGHGRVRLIEVCGCDLQPCGGTHVARSGEIGRVEVTKIKKKGQQNRRISLALAD